MPQNLKIKMQLQPMVQLVETVGVLEEEHQVDGSINIFYHTNTSTSSSITANGGNASAGLRHPVEAAGGGAGGTGTVTKGNISTGEFRAE